MTVIRKCFLAPKAAYWIGTYIVGNIFNCETDHKWKFFLANGSNEQVIALWSSRIGSFAMTKARFLSGMVTVWMTLSQARSFGSEQEGPSSPESAFIALFSIKRRGNGPEAEKCAWMGGTCVRALTHNWYYNILSDIEKVWAFAVSQLMV